ncbi:MAG: penicillin-binding protein 1C [Saprospiraceae bacterium]|nr:penicillin-binding protein 1C [Saprospiraceae bacterium]
MWFYFCLPSPLFKDPYSTVINDKDGQLMGAKIAKDGQWRFPLIDSIPLHFENAILTFEDQRFKKHLGVDPIAIGRAILQNFKARHIESGASTLTMQVIRLSRKGKPRSIFQKIIEMILATRLELSYSKTEILQLYASHAPFGGNVVGLETASWRYFNKAPERLSIAESAMLAVLPNAPSLIHLSKNRIKLKEKRNRLLNKMKNEGFISHTDYELGILEPIPASPFPLPSVARHLLEFVHTKTPGKVISSTIDPTIQSILTDVGNYHYALNSQSDIQNLSILVLDTKTGNTLGYLGNASHTLHESAVDMVQAKRSSGSVLKPMLYAHLVNEGKILPTSLIKDTPTHIQGFNPKNYNRKYSGATPANKALSMSLNVPAVLSLQQYGVEPFIRRLKALGLSTIDKSADHYGLSLILGGAEVNLWELCGAYASMGRILMRYNEENGRYYSGDVFPPSYLGNDYQKSDSYKAHSLTAGSVYLTFKAMRNVIRPSEEGEWEQFESSRPIAWKTGTSYGHRDAWAIGVSPNYTIGVWVGNADGEGKSGLVGVKKAGPVLFDVLNRLPYVGFFEEPLDDLVPIPSCGKSGFLATPYCTPIDTIYTVQESQNVVACPYHKLIHLDSNGYRVSSTCESPSKMNHLGWFELPPSMAYYYRKNHPEYQKSPSFRSDCLQTATKELMSFIYPTEKTSIYIPLNVEGKREQAIFKATHQDPKSILYWHLDSEYLGFTEDIHTMGIQSNPGQHTITIVDQLGNTISQRFEIIQ